MKKIPKSIDIKISPIILYIEDLEEIEEIYKNNFEDYKIIAESKKLEDDFEFASIKEFAEDFNKKGIAKLNNLSFGAYNPHISIEFKNTDAIIYSSDNDVKSIGITNKLKNIVDKRPKFYKYFDSIYLYFLILLLLLLANILPEPIDIVVKVLLTLFFIIWSFWRYNLLTKNYSVIYLKRRNLQKSFLLENKNKIALALIVSLIYIFREIIISKIV